MHAPATVGAVTAEPRRPPGERPAGTGAGAAVVTGVACVVATVLAVARGLAVEGGGRFDVDEAIYRGTVDAMRTGAGYYDAMRDAIVAHQGVGPQHVWAVRPPPAYLLFRLAPPDAWRWLVAVPVLATVVALARLAGRASAAWWAPAAAATVSLLWFGQYTPHLTLHAELWALPLVAWGLVFVGRRPWAAAVLLCGAGLVRETAVVALLAAVAVVVLAGIGVAGGSSSSTRRRSAVPWLVAIGAWLGGLALHATLAARVVAPPAIDPARADPPFFNADVPFDYRVSSLLIGTSWPERLVAAAVLVAGAVGLGRTWRTDPAVPAVAGAVGILALATVVAARPYWQVLWAPLLLAWVPAAVAPTGGAAVEPNEVGPGEVGLPSRPATA